MDIILASASPRRQELLGSLGLSFSVMKPDIDETQFGDLPPATLVETLSAAKAKAIAQDVSQGTLIIAADTIVVLEGEVLGKPESEAHAIEMLTGLSGKSHAVYTGFSLCRGDKMKSYHQMTKVQFRPLSHKEITEYVATGEPLDKAGSYGIQGKAAVFISSIEGDYFNVVGLPLCALYLALGEFGALN